jgi:lipopolysaccharide biosynthesis glycosyltransferase
MSVNVVCTIDEKYSQHCSVMLASLFINNPKIKFNVYIITDNLESPGLLKLQKFISDNENQFSSICIDKNRLAAAPITHHISLATYYRLFIPEILPTNLKQVLFLDSDMVIRKPIDDLLNLNIQNFSHAAAIAAGMDDYPAEIGLPRDSLYFNAGLMMINLCAWRDLKVFERGCQLLSSQSDRIKWWDQDVLNILLHESWHPIDLIWNAQPFIYDLDNLSNYQHKSRYLKFNYLEAKVDPSIVHFVGGGSAKPWHYYCQHPFKDEYLKYLQFTPWKNARLEDRPGLSSRIRFHLGLGSKIHNSLKLIRNVLD